MNCPIHHQEIRGYEVIETNEKFLSCPICLQCIKQEKVMPKNQFILAKTARIDEIIADVKREFYYINDEGEENEASLSIVEKLEEIKKKG